MEHDHLDFLARVSQSLHDGTLYLYLSLSPVPFHPSLLISDFAVLWTHRHQQSLKILLYKQWGKNEFSLVMELTSMPWLDGWVHMAVKIQAMISVAVQINNIKTCEYMNRR